MTTPAGPFKEAQEGELRAAPTGAALAAAMGLDVPKIYTERPPAGPLAAPLPYLVIGEDEVQLTRGDDCADEAEIFSTVHVWARKRLAPGDAPDKGMQAREILGIAIGALNTEFEVEGWEIVEAELESERYVTDPDGSTHGMARFRYLLTEQPIESEA